MGSQRAPSTQLASASTRGARWSHHHNATADVLGGSQTVLGDSHTPACVFAPGDAYKERSSVSVAQKGARESGDLSRQPRLTTTATSPAAMERLSVLAKQVAPEQVERGSTRSAQVRETPRRALPAAHTVRPYAT